MKWTLSLSLLLNVCLGAFVVFSRSDPDKPVYTEDVRPPVSTVIIPPVKDDCADLWRRANTIIDITRKVKIPEPYKGTFEIGILASDTFKSTYVTDSVTVPPTAPKWTIQADLYAGIIDRKAFYMAGVSANYFFSSRMYVGGGLAGSSAGAMVRGSAGFCLY